MATLWIGDQICLGANAQNEENVNSSWKKDNSYPLPIKKNAVINSCCIFYAKGEILLDPSLVLVRNDKVGNISPIPVLEKHADCAD